MLLREFVASFYVTSFEFLIKVALEHERGVILALTFAGLEMHEIL